MKDGKSLPYSLTDLTSRVSSSISAADADGTLFNVVLQKYQTLKQRSLSLIQSHLKKEILEELRPYVNLYIILPTELTLDSIGPR